jgi:hypothetical protein
MPRHWSNGGGQGGCTSHRFVERTPVVTVDYRIADEILEKNAKIAAKESIEKKRLRGKK